MISQRNSLQRLLLVAGVTLTISTLANAINCYQCNSAVDPTCPDIDFKNNATLDKKFLKPCVGEFAGLEPFCRKMVQTLLRSEEHVRVHRSCGWERSKQECYRNEDDDHLEVVCQCFEDGCNPASSLHQRTSTLLLASFGLALVYFASCTLRL